nr:transposon Ty3-I Gag-Pol polyprotein [Tanacetum cinerariifolium]
MPVISYPINVRPYIHPPNQKDAFEGMVKELMDSWVIRASQNPFSSPIVRVKKKDDTWRMCIDYRQLNKHTVKDKFPIPVIEELIDELNGSVVFSKHDLRFIKDYASISQLLVALTKNDAFKWNPSAEMAYHKLKEAMVKALVLALPNFEQESVENKYSWTGGILKRKGKVVVGNDLELRKELVQHFHDEAIGGYSGAHVTMKKLGSLFYWKGL